MTEAPPAGLLPLFPLNSVLFPGGRLNLRVFEARYMDMIAISMREQTSFGICLIAEGNEVGAPALPHKIGVEARVVDWDMSQPGVLGITIKGERRFQILQQAAEESGLLRAAVRWLPELSEYPLKEQHKGLLPLLQAVALDGGGKAIFPPYDFDDARWVGYRYAEILPIQNLARQRLLELDDADMRLDIVQQYLAQRGVLDKAQSKL